MFPRVYAKVSKKQDESASECLYEKEILNLLVKLLKLKLINKESVYLLTLYYIFIGENISDLKKYRYHLKSLMKSKLTVFKSN